MRAASVPREPFLRFDAQPVGEIPRRLCFDSPREVLVANTHGEVAPVIHRVQRALGEGHFAAGYLAYEAGPAFDRALACHPGPTTMPLAWLGIFDRPEDGMPQRTAGSYVLGHWRTPDGQARHRAAVDAIRQSIARGEVYQVNHTFRLQADFGGDDETLYEQMVAAQGYAYGAYLRLGRYRVLSASPELFLERRGDLLTSRPMKGTVRRSADTNAEAHAELRRSPKDRAENVMIVDLVRNDLGRVARPGTVSVPRLFEVEPYCGVHQMTSTVMGTCAPTTTLWDILVALFPAGSISGTPKIAASRIIAALEDDPRGVYCGALGYFEPGGDFRLSVGIRTATLDTTTATLTYGVGGAITWDSDAVKEYDEALAKAEVIQRLSC
ncbi:MAG: chorismate-binding protein [Myxococcota bacterium]